MTYYKLTNAEQKILKAVETGKLKSVPNLKKEIARYQSYAQAMRKETEEINIKLTKLDVQKLKEKIEESIKKANQDIDALLDEKVKEINE